MMKCKYCGSQDLEIIYKMVAKPVGTFSLAGETMKFSVRQWPYLRCNGCQHESRGEPT